MKKLKIFAALLAVFMLSGCNSGTAAEMSAETTAAEESTVITSVRTETTAALVTDIEKLIKYEDGEYYGYKDSGGNIVVSAKYPNSSNPKNTDMTGEAVEVENALYYIDKDGAVFLKMAEAPVVYSDFYNGFAFYDNRFIDEQGNTVYEGINTRNMDKISYWGNGYFEKYFFGKFGHASFIDANGNEKISNSNVAVSRLIGGHAVVDRGKWSVLTNSDLEVKTIFLNTIECEPNCSFIEIFYDIEDKNYLKIRKGYKPAAEPYDFNEIDEIKEIFGNDCDLENVSVYIYDGGETDFENWDLYDEDKYDFVDLSTINNGNIY